VFRGRNWASEQKKQKTAAFLLLRLNVLQKRFGKLRWKATKFLIKSESATAGQSSAFTVFFSWWRCVDPAQPAGAAANQNTSFLPRVGVEKIWRNVRTFRPAPFSHFPYSAAECPPMCRGCRAKPFSACGRGYGRGVPPEHQFPKPSPPPGIITQITHHQLFGGALPGSPFPRREFGEKFSLGSLPLAPLQLNGGFPSSQGVDVRSRFSSDWGSSWFLKWAEMGAGTRTGFNRTHSVRRAPGPSVPELHFVTVAGVQWSRKLAQKPGPRNIWAYHDVRLPLQRGATFGPS